MPEALVTGQDDGTAAAPAELSTQHHAGGLDPSGRSKATLSSQLPMDGCSRHVEWPMTSS